MKLRKGLSILAFCLCGALAGCAGSKFGSAKKNEKVYMKAPPKRDVINYALLKTQQEKPLTLASRGEITSRGVETAFVGGLVSLGITAVKQVIAHEHNKYISYWEQGLNDLYFYDQPSADGPFDPTGMQFNGFSITRTFLQNNETKTAVTADFGIEKDSVASNEIINDAIFRLKLKNIRVNYSKAKVPFSKNRINMDINIVFVTSYLNKDGQMNKDMELGRFSLNLRNAPLDSTAAGYKEYYESLKGIRLYGKSFIVPRSYGYYKTADNNIQGLYNQGLFSIAVEVTETSKNNFANEMLIKTADLSLDYGGGLIMRGVKKKLGNN